LQTAIDGHYGNDKINIVDLPTQNTLLITFIQGDTMKTRLLIVSLSFMISMTTAQAGDIATNTFNTYVSKTGDISLPEGFRQNWTHLGSWLVNDAKAPGHGFHDVYTQPEAAIAFKETGQFPDGTVLVKEIRKIGSGKLTTGDALWATDNAVWFVMIKDAGQRFKGNRNWGEGWGWALFTTEHPADNSSKGYKESCLACHLPAKENDWVFLEGYPTLRPHVTKQKNQLDK
jgi:cytochrome c